VSNKTFIIAAREFVENLRTKAFWIGILAVPVLIAASVVVPIWLDKAKAVRKYVVIDHSGWLLQAIEERTKEPDFEKVLRALLDARIEDKTPAKEVAELEAKLEAAMGELVSEQNLGQEGLAKLAAAFRDNKELLDESLAQAGKLYSQLGRPEGQPILAALPEKVKAAVMNMRQTMIDWWRALPDDDAKQYHDRSGRGKYERIVVEGEGEALIENLNKQVLSEQIFAYFEIGKDPVKNNDDCRYVSSNLTDDDLRRFFEGHASDIVREKRMDSEDIDDQTAEWLLAKLDFEDKQVSKSGETKEVKDEDQARQFAPVAFVYLLWIAIFSIAQMLLTNTVEEKSNRVLEVLLSSVSPLELMLGKIFGIAATGMSMILTWVLTFILCVTIIPGLMGIENFPLEIIARDPILLGSFIAYFLGGYLLYAALFVGIGSVCNSVKEASNLMMPVTMILMVPLFAMIPIMKDPNGSLAMMMSYIPPFTPFVMMNRAAGPPAPYEYALTSVLLVFSILFVIWAAAKVFRVGVLMTGKAPTPKEIFNWIKAPVGHVPTREDNQ
jgi:ABC-2 type transport system permease protein